MAEITVEGLVLARFDSGESDRRLVLLSPEFGKIDAIAKGARKGGSRLAGSSEPLVWATFHLAEGRARRFVSQVQPKSSFPGLRADYERLQCGLALAQFVAAISEDPAMAPEVFGFTLQSLHRLEVHPLPVLALMWACLQLLELEGVAPVLDRCVDTDEPLELDPCIVSPTAGGLVSAGTAGKYADSFSAPAFACLGLARLAEQAEPPAKMKLLGPSFRVLHRVLEHQAHRSLPAMAAVGHQLIEGSGE